MTEELQTDVKADVKRIGEVLRKKREENSYTIEHVAEITRITLSNLKNIENGNLDALPGLVFVRGFIRNYANLLGIESDWMIEALNLAYADKDSSLVPASAKVPRIVKEEKSPSRPKAEGGKTNLPLVPILGGAAAVALLAVLIIWVMASGSDQAKPKEVIQAVEKPATTETAKDQPKAADKNTLSQVISPLNLVLVGGENAWIEIKVDEKPAQKMLLEVGKKYEWPGEESYELAMTTGKTASIYLNGEEIPVKEEQKKQFFQAKLNKFSLTRLNN